MKQIALPATCLALAALWMVSSGVALAHGEKGVAVQPLTPRPGDVITVQGDLLGPGSMVEVRLAGPGVDIDLGEVQADAEGDFTAQFRLPVDLVPRTYQLRATGAESATTELTVLAAAGTANPIGPTVEVASRERPVGETIGLVVLFGVLAGLGLFFGQRTRETVAP